jgi:PIN domain nuclease of toxin-antitoxin system
VGTLKLLLDTCTFIWLCADPAHLSDPARKALSEAGAELLLSDVSVLEVCLKWQTGKLQLPAPPRSWLEEQVRIWRAARTPIARSAIYRSTELPDLHRDPFDRLLVATAIEESATVVTPDEWIRRYPVSCLW